LKKLPRLGLYSSKPTHKNDALWTKSQTITIGDPYNKKHKPDARVTGKQFQSGRREKDHFDDFKALSIMATKKYQSDPYWKNRREKYKSVEGPDMTGFGSKNARNIAMDTMTTRRYAEKLQKETRIHEREVLAKNATLPDLPEVKRRISKSAPSGKEIFLYDRTRSADDESLRRRPLKGKNRRMGSLRASSQVYGAHLADVKYKPSKWLRHNKRKEFYNNGEISRMTLGGGNDYYLNM